jgi:hypothetical protein
VVVRLRVGSESRARLGRGIRFIPILLLVAGCSESFPPAGVIDLKIEGGVVSAFIDTGDGFEIHTSEDGGETWGMDVESEGRDKETLWPSSEHSESVCLEKMCFRTEPETTPVWESSGADEVPSWSFPPGRLKFLERYYLAAPWDIVASGEAVLVAMGNDGILRRGPDGQWTRGVLGDPKPFAKWGDNIDDEARFAWYLAFVTAALATLSTAYRVNRSTVSTGGSRPVFGPFVVLGWVSLIVAGVVSWVLLSNNSEPWGAVFAAFFPGAIALVFTWHILTPFLGSTPKRSLRILRWGPVGIGLVCYLAFLAWSGGIISHHEAAIGVAVVLVAAGLIFLMVASASLRLAEVSPEVTEAGGNAVPVAPAVATEEVAVPVSHASPLKLTAMVSLSIAVISVGFWMLARFTRGGEPLGIGLSLAVMALIGVLYLMARQSGRPDPSGSAIAGALASLVGGPAVGSMFALQPHHSHSTTPRIIAYVLYIAIASVVVSEVGGYALVAALILSPFTVLLGDRWAARPRRVGLSGEFPK